jgi:polysaccharide biosynthesis transport protein
MNHLGIQGVLGTMSMATDSPVAAVPPAQTSIQEPQDKGLDFSLDLARSLRMRRSLAIVAGLFVLLFLIRFGLSRKPWYEATSIIYVQPIVSKTPTDISGSYDSYRYDAYIQQQLLTFKRPDILGHALDLLPPEIRGRFSSDPDDAAKQIANDLKVDRETGSYQLSVTMEGGDPVIVAPIANAVVAAYLQNGQQDDLALSHEQMESLMQERQQILAELDKDRKEQAGLSTALGVADTAADNGNPFDSSLADLRSQLAIARNAHASAEAQLASVNGKQAQLDSAADSATRSDAELSALRQTLGSRRGALIAEMNGLTPQNPLYKKDQAELDQLSQTIDNVSKETTHKSGQSLKEQLTLEAARTGDLQARLEADLARQTATATADTPKLQRAQDLAESIKLLQARYANVDNALHSILPTQNPTFAAHMSLMAKQPTKPKPSKKLLILGLALPVAIIFGVFVAVVAQKIDSRVYIGNDVNRVLSFPPMAVFPDSSEVSPRVKGEFLFRLVAGLDQAHRINGSSTFVFTASSQNTVIDELVSSVAAEMEQLGYRTMTLSASDTLSPIELADFTVESRSSAWQGNPEWARSSNNTALRVRRESLIDEHLDRLKQQVDFLLIKAQPLRSSAETEFVVRLADATLLVAESGITTRKELRSCLALIRRLRARGLVAMVTELKLRNADKEFVEAVHFAERQQRPNRPTDSSEELLTIRRL